jgi:hypothetical protein
MESLHIQESDAPWDHEPERPTSTIQRRTFNHGSRWKLEVGSWTFDVRLRFMESILRGGTRRAHSLGIVHAGDGWHIPDRREGFQL